jgi:hypothetical protein
MGWHTVVLERSFEDHIGSLPMVAQDEIAFVLQCLDTDPYFMPEGEYIAQRDKENFVVCEHARGWGGWVLVWYLEWASTTTTVEKVVAYLHQRSSDEKRDKLLAPKH